MQKEPGKNRYMCMYNQLTLKLTQQYKSTILQYKIKNFLIKILNCNKRLFLRVKGKTFSGSERHK